MVAKVSAMILAFNKHIGAGEMAQRPAGLMIESGALNSKGGEKRHDNFFWQ
jgi:hypothetical protein